MTTTTALPGVASGAGAVGAMAMSTIASTANAVVERSPALILIGLLSEGVIFTSGINDKLVTRISNSYGGT